MTFIQIRDDRDFSKVNAHDWVVEATQSTLQRFDAGEISTEDLGASLQADLAMIANAAHESLDRAVAERACKALGASIAYAIAGGVASGAEADAFLQETVDDLLATIDWCLEDHLDRGQLVEAAQRLLGDAASLSPSEVEEGEHVGDLLLAAANAVAVSSVGCTPA